MTRKSEQWKLMLFLWQVNNRETMAAIEANNDMYCVQKWIEKFPLDFAAMHEPDYKTIRLWNQVTKVA